MFMSGGLEEAPIVGSGSWYAGSLSSFMKGESFWGLVYGFGWGGAGRVMPGRIPLGRKGLWLGCVMTNGCRF